jgi:Tfp pilus assembly protein PilN
LDVEAYKLHDLAAVEEGRPASSRVSRMVERLGGRQLAWTKAIFVVGVIILIIALVGLALGVWQIQKWNS